MRKIRVVCSAFTRLEYTKVIEVSDTATPAEIQALADEIEENTDGGEYYDDPHYWEQGETTWQEDQ